MTLASIQSDMQSAMKARDTVKVETLRYLIAAVKNAGIAQYASGWEQAIKEEDITNVVRRQIKTHRESIDAFTRGCRDDLVQIEKAQLAILESYGPKEASDEEIKRIISEVLASGETNFGKLMGMIMANVAGRADGARVSMLLKQRLQK